MIGMIKSGRRYEDIYNYRNSRYFAQTVKNVRKDEKNRNLVIFAGACQSYYEALIEAGANFASSPARILIDFVDPLVVAEKIATTDASKYLTIQDIEDDLRDGERGINRDWCNRKEKNFVYIRENCQKGTSPLPHFLTIMLQKCNINVIFVKKGRKILQP